MTSTSSSFTKIIVDRLDFVLNLYEIFTDKQIDTLKGILYPNNEQGLEGTGICGSSLIYVMNGSKCGFTERRELIIYTFHDAQKVDSFLKECGYTTWNGYCYIKNHNWVWLLQVEDIGDYLFRMYGERKTASGEMIYYDGTNIWTQPIFDLFAKSADQLCAVKERMKWETIEDLYGTRDENVDDMMQKMNIQ